MSPNRSRAYRGPVPPAQVAARIVRSIRDHAAHGVHRDVSEYTQRPEMVAAVRALLEEDRRG